MINGCSLFLGNRDFRTFMSKGSHNMHKKTRRTMQVMKINEQKTIHLWTNMLQHSTIDTNNYEYLNIMFKSEGFLYNQVSVLLLPV